VSRRVLALRLYGLTAAISIAVMVALLLLPRFVGSPRYLEPQAALVQNMVDRISLREPSRIPEVMDRWSKRLRGKLTLFDAQANVINSTAELQSPPTASERSQLAGEQKWVIDWHRIVVRSDDGKMIGVYVPNSLGFPWGFVIPLAASVLLVVGLATLWFSRRLVRPLDTLAAAAQRFGSGDTTARGSSPGMTSSGMSVVRSMTWPIARRPSCRRSASSWPMSRTSCARHSHASASHSSLPSRIRARPRKC